jgi:shikimate kinase
MSGHIFLVGFMGAGKSTVAGKLAERLGLAAIDIDDVVETESGRSITAIFSEDGESVFRGMESDVLESLGRRDPSVVACGGGIVLHPSNRAALKRMGTVVYLSVTAEEALARVGDCGTRPILAGAAGALAPTLLAAREGLYRSVADVVVDTVGLQSDAVVDRVAKALEEMDR